MEAFSVRDQSTMTNRVFVVGTGRCGTSTFYHAAKHIVGWTAGHETAAGGVELPDWPEHHIEVDAQLVYRIPSLKHHYPDAKWVHLLRDQAPCVASLAGQSYEAMLAFSFQWFQTRSHLVVPAAAAKFYKQTNELIAELLPNAFRVHIEELEERWGEFCNWLGVTCHSDVYQEFGRAYNPGVARGRDSYVELEGA